MRAGLAVVSFSVVERFLRDRSAEATLWIRHRGLGATNYSDALRRAATVEALQGVRFQAELRRRNGEDPTPYIQGQAKLIHESSSTVAFADPTFFYDKPNINGDDVATVLKVFGVGSGWSQIEKLARRVGVPLLSASEAFKNAASRRHAAAHQGGPPLPSSDLLNFVAEAVGICLAFDALVSRACKLFSSRDPGYLDKGLDESSIQVRLVEQTSDGWFREIGGGPRAVARRKDLAELLRHTVPRAVANGEFVVVHAPNGIPVDWRSCDLEVA